MLKVIIGRRCDSDKLDVETKATEVVGWILSSKK